MSTQLQMIKKDSLLILYLGQTVMLKQKHAEEVEESKITSLPQPQINVKQ